MSFKKGVSGNPLGRPKLTAEQKEEREAFKELLQAATVDALQSIILIANDRYSKDRLNACKYIIDKAYGANTAFLLDGKEETSPIVIEIAPHRQKNEDDWEEDEWNGWKASPDDDVDDWDDWPEEDE